MEIKNFIKIYDEVMPLKILSNLIRFIGTRNFKKAGILGENNNQEINFNIRRTYTYGLSNMSNSLSDVHWSLFLNTLFKNNIIRYTRDLNVNDFPIRNIIDIAILKYENTGFYTWHTDHAAEIPRTMSCILLLNNDYKGGNLCFRNPDQSEEWEVEVKPNRLIIWPSNFLYPHTVKSVTEGIRYSIVAWAL
jgi:hypothetical protein